jgi:hypothetical protein
VGVVEYVVIDGDGDVSVNGAIPFKKGRRGNHPAPLASSDAR